MTDAMFDLPSQKEIKQLKVDRSYALKKLGKEGESRLRVA
jgi:hypothetical protein